MATFKINLKGVAKVAAKGKTYYYAWRGGPRIMADIGTPEFIEEFNALRNPQSNLDRSKFGAWPWLYRAHKEKDGCGGKKPYCALAKSTKKNWDPLIDDAQERFGKLSVRLLDRPTFKKDIREWRKQWTDTPRMADLALQALSRVCSFMVAQGAIAVNPCAGFGSLYESDRSELIWPDDYLTKLYAAASRGVADVVRLGELTGLRQGDCLRLKWTQIDQLHIKKPTRKSRGKQTANIPIYRQLREFLATIPRRGEYVLTNSHGRPWKTGFGSSWQDAMDRAGLGESGLHFHDLRGTACTRFYAAGLTLRDIADIMGWSEESVQSMIDKYVSRDALDLDRIRRIEQRESENCKTDDKTNINKIA